MKNEIMRLADEFACYISNGSSVKDQGRRTALLTAVEKLAAENEQLQHLYRHNENEWQNRYDALHAELASAEAVNKAAALEIVSLRAEIEAAKADAQRKDEALLNIARKAEMLKRECGDDPESPQAIRNGRYMHLSYLARAAIKGVSE